MPDDLYHRDLLAWSQHQADLLRRLGRGERVNDIDWELVAEEIEDVGRSELRGTRNNLRLLILHLLKLRGWPASRAANHWRSEIIAFQAEAAEDFAPSMRQNLDIAALYRIALRQVQQDRQGGKSPRALPTECPFTLDQLLRTDPAILEDMPSAL